MHDNEYQELVDETFADMEDRVDQLALDIDVDSSGGLLTFTLEDGSNVILSRQVANHEIWVAAKSGGFHLKLGQDDVWRCATTGEDLAGLINRVFSEQAREAVILYP